MYLIENQTFDRDVHKKKMNKNIKNKYKKKNVS